MSNKRPDFSIINGFKYRKMDDLEDEINLFQVEDEDNLKPNIKFSKRVKKFILISLSIITLIFLLFITIVVFVIPESSVNYKGYKVYKLLPLSVEDLNAILRIEKNFGVFIEN